MALEREYYALPPPTERKGPHQLQLKKGPIPELGPRDVLVRIHAVSLNFRDLIIACGKFPLTLKQDELIPLSDGAGEIVQVGPQVQRWKKDDRVASLCNPRHQKGSVPSNEEMEMTMGSAIDGVLSQYIVLDQDHVVRIPDHLSYEEASALPCAALTAYNALFGLEGHELRAGDKILVEGTGGVSLFAAQFAVATGATVIVTSSSDAKLEMVKKSVSRPNLIHTINYNTTPDWDQKSLELVGPVDHVLEVAGPSTIGRAISAAGPGCAISVIGIVAEIASHSLATRTCEPLADLLVQIILKSLVLRGVVGGSRGMFEQMNKLIDAHKLKPIIGQIFSWKDAQKAYGAYLNHDSIGKIVIRVD